jgi:hypothetical protein
MQEAFHGWIVAFSLGKSGPRPSIGDERGRVVSHVTMNHTEVSVFKS